MITSIKQAVVTGLLAALTLTSTIAGEQDLSRGIVTDVETTGYDKNFQALNWEFRNEIGYFNGINQRDFQPESIDYVVANTMFGMMLYSPTGPSLLRGNAEFFMGLSGGGFVSGPGSYIAPVFLLALQYNFVQEGSRWVPFIGVNGGAVFIDPKLIPTYAGSEFNFTYSPYAGLRCFINDDWSVQATANFNHMSNMDTTSNNHGIEGMGGMIGVSYYFE
ncbi:MAG: acyloxyacyl hydrolase [Verrucomicrobiota bacterium]|nr:acyloxyacyl hydrolase [Verrucomicrobiota bacterium]